MMIGSIGGELLGAALLGAAGGSRNGSAQVANTSSLQKQENSQPQSGANTGAVGGPAQANGAENAPKASGAGGQAEMKGAGKTGKGRFDRNECQTCKSRTYQDGSNDPGVSFKSPTQISADQSASAVMGHEMEHVNRNRAKAASEGREVISQSVTLHNAICPECGRAYVAGGVTRTVTANRRESPYNVGKSQDRQPGNSLNAVA